MRLVGLIRNLKLSHTTTNVPVKVNFSFFFCSSVILCTIFVYVVATFNVRFVFPVLCCHEVDTVFCSKMVQRWRHGRYAGATKTVRVTTASKNFYGRHLSDWLKMRLHSLKHNKRKCRQCIAILKNSSADGGSVNFGGAPSP